MIMAQVYYKVNNNYYRHIWIQSDVVVTFWMKEIHKFSLSVVTDEHV